MVTICQTCGDRGFTVALIFCDECQIYAVHRYCLPVLPETFDEYVVWLCEDCESKAIKPFSVDKLNADCESLGILPGKKRKSVTKFEKQSKRKTDTTSLHDSKVLGPEKSSSLELLVVDCSENIENDQEYEGQKGFGDCSFDKSFESLRSKNSQLDLGDCQPPEMVCSGDGEKVEKHGKDVLNEDSLHEEAHFLKTKNSLASTTPEAKNSEEGEMDQKLGRQNALDSDCYNKEAERLNGLNKGSLHQEVEAFETKKTELAGQDIDLLEIVCFKDREQDQNHDGWNNLDEGIFSEEANPCGIENNPNIVEQNYVPAQPIEEPIWRGSLNILDNSNCRMLGLVAHVSNLACPKVSEEARSLPAVLSPELLPRSTLWPKGFAKWGPSDDSIALYFFPDNERSEKAFDGLVDDMICRDLGIRAVIQNVELLIFSSTLMPMDFWRFQAKFYLWGVFKAKRPPRAAADAILGVEKSLEPVMGRQSPVSTLGDCSYSCGSMSSALSPSML